MPNTRKNLYIPVGLPEPKRESIQDIEDFRLEGNVAVLAITSHGDIQIEYNLLDTLAPSYSIIEPVKFSIPDDMEVIGIEVVSPSVPNLLPPKNTRPFMNIIKRITSEFNQDSTVEQMNSMVDEINTSLSELDDQPYEVIEQFRQKNTDYTEDKEVRAYFYHTELLYRKNNYKEIQPFNKQYLRENNLVTDNKRSSHFYDWKINVLNSVPETDLISVLNQRVGSLRSSASRNEFTVTRLNKVIEYLYNKGIRKVILVDFSCSVIRKKMDSVTEREERYIALQHNRTRRGGRRLKNKRNKRTKKNRK
jgi:uncharacterized coiled-coil protein SlyX